jgi:ATP phosphoribosyltransferase/ATP phosphoribosyltransferase regulatory subunit
VEIAPLTGLTDAIVEVEQIAEATARLIANPVSHKLKAAAIDELVDRMRTPR